MDLTPLTHSKLKMRLAEVTLRFPGAESAEWGREGAAAGMVTSKMGVRVFVRRRESSLLM